MKTRVVSAWNFLWRRRCNRIEFLKRITGAYLACQLAGMSGMLWIWLTVLSVALVLMVWTAVCRLHDFGARGHWLSAYLLCAALIDNLPRLAPGFIGGGALTLAWLLAGAIFCGILIIIPGAKDENRFGPPPKGSLDALNKAVFDWARKRQ